MNAPCQGCHDRPSPRFARDEWRAHPHFPSQTLLLGSHENFLRISRTLCERAGAPDALLSWLAAYFDAWIAAMRSHERYEEKKLYPYLERRYDVSLSCLRAEHQALHDAYDDVIIAFEEGDAALAKQALERHHAVLEEHLREEEDRVIPMLLDMEPEEFVRYTTSPLSVLLESSDI